MRNRLVSRLKDDKIHNRMLFEGARLTWEKTVELYFAADFQNNYAVKGSSAESISVHRVVNTPTTMAMVTLGQGQTESEVSQVPRHQSLITTMQV